MKAIILLIISVVTIRLTAQTNTFPTSGNTGVGTTSPAVKLHVLGDALVSPLVKIEDNIYSSSAWLNAFTTGGGYQGLGFSGIETALSNTVLSRNWLGVHSPFGVREAFSGTPDNIAYSIYTNAQSRMTIASNGNIGVGTREPATKLHVLGDALVFPLVKVEDNIYSNTAWLNAFTTGGGYQGLGFSGFEAALSNTALSRNWFGVHSPFGVREAFSGTPDNIAYSIYTNAQSRMTIASNGNIGVGTASPSAKFHVIGDMKADGTIYTKKVHVTQSGWSDYVFDDVYKLRSLASLETFIKQNQHLPELPSAKEVAEKGIDIGDNQALLLKKIEELTLYIIELNKENTAMKKAIQQLEKVNKIKSVQNDK